VRPKKGVEKEKITFRRPSRTKMEEGGEKERGGKNETSDGL